MKTNVLFAKGMELSNCLVLIVPFAMGQGSQTNLQRHILIHTYVSVSSLIENNALYVEKDAIMILQTNLKFY
jgi:hypothetical protein